MICVLDVGEHAYMETAYSEIPSTYSSDTSRGTRARQYNVYTTLLFKDRLHTTKSTHMVFKPRTEISHK